MEKKSLYILQMVDGKEVLFPNATEPVRLNTATYTAQRMGGTPTLTADFYYPRILDTEWTREQYVWFRGERYYVDQQPSVEKNNDKALYKHSVTFVSERVVLEHEFFYDVVTDSTEAQYKDRYRSNVSKFSFYGDIKEFASRLNDSLTYVGFASPIYDKDGSHKLDDSGNKMYDGYHVVIDEGYTSDVKEISFENKRITEALQEISSTFKLAYYFKSKEIHVGYTENVISRPFEYGAEGGLLKIQHNNSNEAIVDRITGVGSTDNLPYYYPNESADGEAVYWVSNSGEDEVREQDIVETISLSTLYEHVKSPIGKTFMLHHAPTYVSDNITDQDKKDWEFIPFVSSDWRKPAGLHGIGKTYSAKLVYVTQPIKANKEDGIKLVSRFEVPSVAISPDSGGWKQVADGGMFAHPDIIVPWNNRHITEWEHDDGPIGRVSTSSPKFYIIDAGEAVPDTFPQTADLVGSSYYKFYEAREYRIAAVIEVTINLTRSWEQQTETLKVYAPCGFALTVFHDYTHSGHVGDSGYYFSYTDGEDLLRYEGSGITFKDVDKLRVAKDVAKFDRDKGFVVAASLEDVDGTRLQIKARKWINPTQNLMPSIYRDSLGGERYFNATNDIPHEKIFEDVNGVALVFNYDDAYKIGQTEDCYTFLNTYKKGDPHADYQSNEDIKPTIKDVRNDVILRKTKDGKFSNDPNADYAVDEAGNYIYENYVETNNKDGEIERTPAGQLYGEIADIAFDDHDSDATKNVSSTAEYIHSYFYIKLHKFSGDMAFNIFDYASESDTAKINMTSGNCAGCSFEIGVPEPREVANGKYKFYNPVQVKEDGSIADGDYTGNMRESEAEANTQSSSHGVHFLPKTKTHDDDDEEDDKTTTSAGSTTSSSEYSTTIAEGDFGDKVRVGRYQDVQQDTSKNEVWIALKKENSTFGIVMPNATQGYRPQIGDTFTITGINAPQKYITAAEKRLDKALVKYMAEHNVEKFNFSITFSRIWLTDHPNIANLLNENARLTVKYNGVTSLLYVTNYSVKMDDNILEEITVNLAETIGDTAQATLTARLGEMKEDILNTVSSSSNSGILSQMRKYFLVRDGNATRQERTMQGTPIFQGGIETTDANVSGSLNVTGETTISNLQTPDFSEGAGGKGAGIYTDQDGVTHIEADVIEARKITDSQNSLYHGWFDLTKQRDTSDWCRFWSYNDKLSSGHETMTGIINYDPSKKTSLIPNKCTITLAQRGGFRVTFDIADAPDNTTLQICGRTEREIALKAKEDIGYYAVGSIVIAEVKDAEKIWFKFSAPVSLRKISLEAVPALYVPRYLGELKNDNGYLMGKVEGTNLILSKEPFFDIDEQGDDGEDILDDVGMLVEEVSDVQADAFGVTETGRVYQSEKTGLFYNEEGLELTDGLVLTESGNDPFWTGYGSRNTELHVDYYKFARIDASRLTDIGTVYIGWPGILDLRTGLRFLENEDPKENVDDGWQVYEEDSAVSVDTDGIRITGEKTFVKHY